jgi:hypothetical protein
LLRTVCCQEEEEEEEEEAKFPACLSDSGSAQELSHCKQPCIFNEVYYPVNTKEEL